MIPKRVTKVQEARAKAFVASLPAPDNKALSERAQKNSFLKKPGLIDGLKRIELSGTLRKYRLWDVSNAWRVSFEADLKQTNTMLGTNLLKLIRSRAIRGNILEIGPGAGVTITELAQKVPTAHFFALGLRNLPLVWQKQKNFKQVDWRVGHSEKLVSVFQKDYFDVVYSTLGVTHAPDILRAFQQLHAVLKKGGIAIVNLEAMSMIAPSTLKAMGFHIKKTTPIFFTPYKKYEGQLRERSVSTAIVYTLKKA